MKNKFTLFYTIFISVIYILAISYFGFNLYVEYSSALEDPFYTFNTANILISLEKSFFIILIATLLTIILLIVSYKKFSKKSNKNSIEIIEESDNLINEEAEYEEEQDLSDEIYENEEMTIFEQVEEEETEYLNNEEQEIEQISLPSEEEKPVQMEPNSNIFSPTTGFCFEAYLSSRLENELNRAIASELDLSLFVIKVSKLDKKSEKTQEICKYLTEQFQFNDLLFEFKDDCFVAIKNKSTLDAALVQAEKIHSEITNILNNEKQKCYIGISTRTIRMITGERLLTEATEALRHAEEDEKNPIIAFRANAEKYMKMMQNQ